MTDSDPQYLERTEEDIRAALESAVQAANLDSEGLEGDYNYDAGTIRIEDGVVLIDVPVVSWSPARFAISDPSKAPVCLPGSDEDQTLEQFFTHWLITFTERARA